jgi:hypothetical protein
MSPRRIATTEQAELPTLRCRECFKVGHMTLWSNKPHSPNAERLRWPVHCRNCDTMALSSHRAVRALVAKVAHVDFF